MTESKSVVLPITLRGSGKADFPFKPPILLLFQLFDNCKRKLFQLNRQIYLDDTDR